MSSSANAVSVVSTLKPGIYIQNDSGGYWYATGDQAIAFKKFPRWKYEGQGSTYWMGNSKAEEKVKGKRHTFNMVLAGTNFWLKTRDKKMRHIMEIVSPPEPPK